MQNVNSKKLIPLELLRILSALWVFADHFVDESQLRALHFFGEFGQFPVIIFFILSGFVIGLRHLRKRETLTAYIRARAIRIFPIYIFVLIFSTSLLCLRAGWALKPEERSLADLFANSLMLQGPTFFIKHTFVPWMSNGPFWSLSLEWWFYLIFGAAARWFKFDQIRIAVLVLGAISLTLVLLTSNFLFLVLALFPIWWSGVELAQRYTCSEKISLPSMQFLLAAFLLCSSSKYLFEMLVTRGLIHTSVNYRYIFNFYFYAFIIVICACLGSSKLNWRPNQWCDAFSKMGAISYSFYLVHWLFIYAIGFYTSSRLTLLLALPISLCVAYVLELIYQPFVVSLFSQRFRRLELAGELAA